MQTQMSSTPASDDTSDAVLLLRTREGDAQAYGSLYLRHVGAAKVLARQLARDPSEADELVAESFTRVLGVLQRGAGPEAALRPYLLSTMRRLHIDRRVAERKVEPTDDFTAHDQGEPFVDLPADELERSIVSTAYASLPERWRLVLWHTEVEGLAPAQVAPLLGISANATAALAVRARAGLRDAYLSAHVSEVSEPGCREISNSLGGYVRGTLSRRERGAVDQHLDTCVRCSAAVLELSDTASTMRGVVGPLVLGALALAYREGVLALGPHAIPSAAVLHSAAAASAHAAAGTTSAASATSAHTITAAGTGQHGVLAVLTRPTWQVLTGAGVAATVVAATVIGVHLSGGGTPAAADRPTPSISAPASTSGPAAEATAPGPSITQTPSVVSPTTAPTTDPANPAVPSTSATTPVTTAVLQQPSGVSLDTVGDLVAGQGGTVRVTSTNPAKDAVTQTMEVHLPSGVTASSFGSAIVHGSATSVAFRSALSRTAAGPGSCVSTSYGARCNLGSVGSRIRTTVTLPVFVADGATGAGWRVVVTSTAGERRASSTASGKMTVRLVGVRSLWAGTGPYLVTAAGNSLMSCQNAARPVSGCSATEQRSTNGARADNDAWAMYPRNDAGSGWKTSSKAAITLPSGSIAAAFLTWSASGFTAVDGLSRTARIDGPGIGATTVTAASYTPASLGTSGNGYVATADVTALVRQATKGRGSWTVGNIAMTGGGQKSVYGGWALTVITTSATAPIRAVTVLAGPWDVTQGHDWTGTAPGLADNPAELTMVAWEGDAGLTGDRIMAHQTYLSPKDGVSGSDNIAASYAMGATRAVTFGTDVRQLAVPKPTTKTKGSGLRITTQGDNWILGMLVVSAGSSAGL